MPTLFTSIGGVHGKIEEYNKIVARSDRPTIQVGDMGVGLPGVEFMGCLPGHGFIHGNHDDPAKCEFFAGYYGRYNFFMNTSIMLIGGAASVDRKRRTPGLDYWFNEELNLEEMEQCEQMYTEAKPSVIISHDCPVSLYPKLLSKIGADPDDIAHSRTNHFLEKLLQLHAPKFWVFGHWHTSWRAQIGQTSFACLNELETLTLTV